MARSSSLWKWAALVIGIAVLASIALPIFSSVVLKRTQIQALSNMKVLGFACRSYASDHAGNYPPSLDALFPKYLPDRSILASPLMPSEPAGYIYTPGLKDTSPSNTVLIEAKFATSDTNESSFTWTTAPRS